MLLGFVSQEMISRKTSFKKYDPQKTENFPYIRIEAFVKHIADIVDLEPEYFHKIESGLTCLLKNCDALIALHEYEFIQQALSDYQLCDLLRSYLEIISISKEISNYHEPFVAVYASLQRGLNLALGEIYTIDEKSLSMLEEKGVSHKDYHINEKILKNQGLDVYYLQLEIDKKTFFEKLISVHNHLSHELRAQVMNYITSDCFFSNRVGASIIVVDAPVFNVLYYPWSGNLQSDRVDTMYSPGSLEIKDCAKALYCEIKTVLKEMEKSLSTVLPSCETEYKLVIFAHPFVRETRPSKKCINALVMAYKNKLISIEGQFINFNCELGSLAQFFRDCGDPNWKDIDDYIICKGKALPQSIKTANACMNYSKNIGMFIFPEKYSC